MQYMIVAHDWMADVMREAIGPFASKEAAIDYTKDIVKDGDSPGLNFLVTPLNPPHDLPEIEKFSPKLKPGVAMIALVHYDAEALLALSTQFKGVLNGEPPDFDELKQHLCCGRLVRRTDDTVTIKGMDGNVTIPLEHVLTVIYGI